MKSKTLYNFKLLEKKLPPSKFKKVKIFSIIFLLSFSLFIIGLFSVFTKPTPGYGGQYTEGIVGYPRLINPIYIDKNPVDRDIAKLLYSGLVKYDGETIIPDLAEKWDISKDQKTYTFYLKKNINWPDGKKFTSKDVKFTFDLIKNRNYKSPLINTFGNIKIETPDEYTVKFILPKPLTPFLESLQTGILPEHIWSKITPESMILTDFNIKPVGLGPYIFEDLVKDKFGKIHSYTVKKNKNYHLGEPKIDKITFKFYPNFEEALQNLKINNIDGISSLPVQYKKDIDERDVNINKLQLPQYTAVFFNLTSNSPIKDKNVRKALAYATNKEQILKDAIDGNGSIIHGPILPNYPGFNPDIEKFEYNPEKAMEILDENGWTLPKEEEGKEKDTEDKQALSEDKKSETNQTTSQTENTNSNDENKNEDKTDSTNSENKYRKNKKGDILEISITTADIPELSNTAQILKEDWEKINVKVNLNIIDISTLQTKYISKRNYEILIFGEIVGVDPDPYPFWHSSQISTTGLNLSNFKNKEADKVLEDARKIADFQAKNDKYIHFQNILIMDIPAIFLYNPNYLYPVSKKVKTYDQKRIITPSDRFANIEKWYINTKRVINKP